MTNLTRPRRTLLPTLLLIGVIVMVPALAWRGSRHQEKPAAQAPPAGEHFPYTNRLIHETSPYLLQHAHNPVDWYPWGPEAWEKAKRENRPIFLSVGYSACHWCHVMEREDFENEEVAKLLNADFVAVKVDREQRPDIDAQYMLALQMMTGAGGWPMSLFLTPDRKPFFGGTYFPPEEFKPLLQKVADVYRAQPDRVRAQADQVAAAVAASAKPGASAHLRPETLQQVTLALQSEYDPAQGGFAPKPKFPEAPNLAYLLARYRHTDAVALLHMVTNTLDHMADGGLYDQIGGGFHRYSTDAIWRVPHFEKMLYDQAQLVPIYLEAYQITHTPRYRQVAEETLAFVSREMRTPEGGFISTIDADSEGEEGKYYLWTPEQVRSVLGADAPLFSELYGVTATGDLNGKSVLHVGAPLAKVAQEHGIAAEALAQRVEEMREKLRTAREQRVHPNRDDKALANWNGLMIAAYARAAQALNSASYRQTAIEAAEFVETKMMRDGALLHSYRSGRADVPAMLEDDAFTAYGLLALYDATHEPRWLDRARQLAADMAARFSDPNGGFYATTGQGELLTRLKSGQDDATPSGNGIAAQVFLRLAAAGDPSAQEQAAHTVEAFEPLIARAPHAFPTLLAAYQEFGNTPLPAAPPSHVALQVGSITVTSDGLYHVTLRLQIASGWHINAHKPSASDLIPTILRVSAPADAQIVSIDYPPAQQTHFAYSPEPLAVYRGVVTISATFKLTRSAPAHPIKARMILSYQPCNDRACLTPTTTPIDVTFPAG